MNENILYVLLALGVGILAFTGITGVDTLQDNMAGYAGTTTATAAQDNDLSLCSVDEELCAQGKGVQCGVIQGDSCVLEDGRSFDSFHECAFVDFTPENC